MQDRRKNDVASPTLNTIEAKRIKLSKTLQDRNKTNNRSKLYRIEPENEENYSEV